MPNTDLYLLYFIEESKYVAPYFIVLPYKHGHLKYSINLGELFDIGIDNIGDVKFSKTICKESRKYRIVVDATPLHGGENDVSGYIDLRMNGEFDVYTIISEGNP